LMETLEASGQADNTIVVFSSYHGCMLFNHDRGWKCKPWRESVGVPLIMRWPGHIPAGRASGGPISLVDHMPSLLSMVGAAVPEEVEGLDLSRYILGEESAAPDSVFINHPLVPSDYSYPEWRGVVTQTHTYARTREEAWMLYDDIADPMQTVNLANDPAHAALQGRLDAELQEWLVRTRDPFEPSAVVAEKYLQGHDPQTLEIPFYENETIRNARKRMSGES
jgi:arylsulfatase A-like enzyme